MGLFHILPIAMLLVKFASADLTASQIAKVFPSTTGLTEHKQSFANAYDLHVVASEKTLLAQMTDRFSKGWLGLGMGGDMPMSDVYVAWKFEDEWQMNYGVPSSYSRPSQMSASGTTWALRRDLSTADSVVFTRDMAGPTVSITQATLQPFLMAVSNTNPGATDVSLPSIGIHSMANILRFDMTRPLVLAPEDAPPSSAPVSEAPTSTIASSGSLPSASSIPSTPAPVANQTLVDCLAKAAVDAVYSDDTAYAQDTHAFNLRLNYQPSVVVHPMNTTQVSLAVKCALASNLKVAPRSSYHSFVNYPLQAPIVIDLQRMNKVSVTASNAKTNTATIEPGAATAQVISALAEKGWGYPHPLGSYPGFGGSSTGGTLGLQSRMWGLTMDLIEEMTVVLASGKVVTANAKENKDLYMAMRGAAASYGIITSFKLKVHKAIANPIRYTYVLRGEDGTGLAKIFSAIQEFGLNRAPPELSLRWSFPGVQNATTRLQGNWYGSQAKFNATMAPLLKSLPTPPESTIIQSMTYLESEIASTGDLNVTAPDTQNRNFYIKAMLTPEKPKLSSIELQDFWNHWYVNSTSFPGITLTGFIDLWGGKGSAANKPSKSATAMPWRDTLFIFRTDAVTTAATYPEGAIEFLSSFQQQITKHRKVGQYGGYPNYRDSALSGEEWKQFVHGSNYKKLSQIKKKYDPTRFFNTNPQIIDF